VSTRTAQAGTLSRLMMAIAAVSALALSMIWLAGPALAEHDGPWVAPDEWEGAANKTCGEFGTFDFEFKVNVENPNGTFDEDSAGVSVTSPTDFEVTIETTDNVLSWESNFPVDAVFVKGGPIGGNLYDYSELAFDVLHDNGLTTAGGGQYGVSHVSFCFNGPPDESVAESESAEQSVAESEAESVAESEEESGEQSVEAGTGTPEESTADSSLFGEGSSPLATVAFSLILLASLGGLAYANVKTVRSRI